MSSIEEDVGRVVKAVDRLVIIVEGNGVPGLAREIREQKDIMSEHLSTHVNHADLDHIKELNSAAHGELKEGQRRISKALEDHKDDRRKGRTQSIAIWSLVVAAGGAITALVVSMMAGGAS